MTKKILILFILFSCRYFYSQNLDFKVLKAVNQTDMPCWDNTMKGVSFSVYPVMPVSLVGIWTQGFINKDELMMRNGYKSAVSIAFAIGFAPSPKPIVSRFTPTMPVIAPPNGSRAEGLL
ncbi:MAG: hypothetical protein WCH21_09450 [Bacteroidota bacterium]